MQIDRSNYEIWLIDWLDGNLNQTGVDRLKLFLKDNPDLKEEYKELSLFSLSSSDESYPHKNNLKKTSASMPVSQFEYLCVAYLENDLTSEQHAELIEIIDNDPRKKLAFDLLLKARLSPPENTFKHRNRLLRTTFAQKIIRISAIGLSAAAVTALLVVNYISEPRPLPVKPESTAQTSVPVNRVQEPILKKVPLVKQNAGKKIRITKTTGDLLAVSKRKASSGNASDLASPSLPDSIVSRPDPFDKLISKVPVSFDSGLKGAPLPNSLIELKITMGTPAWDDSRSNLSRFIAKTIRERILKKKIPEYSPIKGYELAEAGVSGLNKLLGWQMALDEKRDENGELKSVYFSSRLLKFNAPVKKTEPLQ
jgi:hypothetical protein